MNITHRGITLAIGLTLVLGLFTRVQADDDKTTLTLATMNWEPYYSEHLPQQGYLSQISRAALAHTHYRLDIKFVPWRRAIEDSKAGVWDGVLGAYHTKERENFFSYTKPIVMDETVFVALKGSNISYRSLQDLRDYKIGYIFGGKYTREFDRASYLTKEAVAHDGQNLKKLLAKRIDLFVSSRPIVIYHLAKINSTLKSQVEFVDPPLMRQGMYIMISKKLPDHKWVVEEFNRGLKAIKSDGTLSRILLDNQINPIVHLPPASDHLKRHP